MLNHLDLFKIRLIGALVKSESLVGAAKELRITSSAVSQNIRSLERSLGKPLFLRVGKKIKATPLASEIYKRGQPFFSDLANLLEESNELVAEVRIAAPPVFGSTILMDQLEKVRANHSSIRIVLTLLDTRRIIEDLTDGKFDFGFIDSGPHVKALRDISIAPYFSEELVLCCSEGFRKKHLGKGVLLKALKELPHIPYHHEKEGIHKWYLHHFGRVPELKWSFAVDHSYAVLNAVQKGWGLGVLPRNLAAEKGREVFIINGPKAELKSEVLLAQNKNRVPTKFEKAVIGLLLQASHGLPGSSAYGVNRQGDIL